MSTRIPLPGNMIDTLMKGVNTGSGMYSGIMGPILDREKQAQAEKHFQEQLKLQKAAAARAGANSDLNRSILQQQLLGLQHKNDPNYEFNQFKALQDMIMGGGQPGGSMPGVQQPQGQPGMNFDALRQNPMLRGFFKHKFGFDPLAAVPQTPEDKQAAAIDLFKQKEAIKQDNKAGDIATNKILTQNQSALQAIDTVMPMLDEFIKHPDKVYGQFDFSPSKKAAYEAKTGGMIDMLVAAQALPQVKESVELVKDQVRRRANETTPAYIKRLKDFKKDLAARRSKSKSVVESKRVNTQGGGDEFAHMSDDELRKIAGGG